MSTADAFLSGLMVTMTVIASLFFLRFWRRTRDRLFAIFAAAFLFLATHWMLRVFVPTDDEHRPYLYVGRLIAFVLIALAIVDKNRDREPPK